MKKAAVYLDTTVPSAYFDDRAPDRMRLTQAFWSNADSRFSMVISEVVLAEIEATRNEKLRADMLELVAGIERLEVDQEAQMLAQEYIDKKVFPKRYFSDGLHVAVTVVHRVEYLVSWNFSHLVKVNTRREVNRINALEGYGPGYRRYSVYNRAKVNLINALKGYGPVEIVAPPEL